MQNARALVKLIRVTDSETSMFLPLQRAKGKAALTAKDPLRQKRI
jgi:hypothetical protein